MSYSQVINARLKKEQTYFQMAYDLGKELALAGFRVANGAGFGLMDQSLKGAYEAGGETIGIGLDIENRAQSKYAKNLTVYSDIKERQKKLVDLGQGFIALPGGMGTLYEIFEIIALKRVNQLDPKIPLVLLGDYYASLKSSIETVFREGFTENTVADYFSFSQTPKEAVKKISTL